MQHGKRRGILDMLVEELNSAEKESGGTGTEWKRMHNAPYEIIDIRGVGRIRREIKTSQGERP